MKKEWKNEVRNVGYLAIMMLLLFGSLPLYGVFAEENVSDEIIENTASATIEDTYTEQSTTRESEVNQTEVFTEESTVEITDGEISSDEITIQEVCEEVSGDEMSMEIIAMEEISVEETMAQENPIYLDNYLLSGNESVTITRNDGSVIKQGERFQREYFITLDDYYGCDQNIQGNHLLQTSYNVYGNGEIIQSGTLMLGSEGGDSFTMEYEQTGEYTIEILASGYVESEGEYLWVSDKMLRTVTDSVEKTTLQVQANIEKDGHFSYRDDYGRSVALSFFMEEGQIENMSNVRYHISSSNEMVIKPAEEQQEKLVITGVGQAELTVGIEEHDFYQMSPLVISVTVNDSPIKDVDYHIVYMDAEGTQTLFSGDIQDWKEFLVQKKYWLNGSLCLSLSEEGEKYYTGIGVQVNQGEVMLPEEKQHTLTQEMSMYQYDFWCSHPQKNACTKASEYGVHSFSVGFDKTAPQSIELTYEEKAYEPTSTTLTRYYGESLCIQGAFEDTLSGVESIEYTTQADLGNAAEWKTIQNVVKDGIRAEYELVLEQGIFTGIAVRAIDVAGNVSKCIGLQSEQGEYIKFIVDKTSPVPVIMSKTLDEVSYQGAWTNQPITIIVTEPQENQPIAGIRSIQYQYASIGVGYQTQEWTDLPESGTLHIENDQNGTYFFRAISNTGIVTPLQVQKESAVRVRLQQTIAEKPPIIETAPQRETNQVWYNKKTGVPIIQFNYPEYDNGVISMEYDAPIMVHTRLSGRFSEEEVMTPVYQTAAIGISSDEGYQKLCAGEKEVIEDRLDELTIDFSYDETSGYATDGIYELEYWITDAAGNESEHDVFTYQIDTHEPQDLAIFLEGTIIEEDTSQAIHIESFYQAAVSGNVRADFGISEKGSIKLMVAKEMGDWQDNTNWIRSDSFTISPCTSGCFYMIAEDAAGNQAILRTRGIVVDNQSPTGENGGKGITVVTKANENGFYHGDIEVKLSMSDLPQSQGFSALESVSYAVGTTGVEKEQGEELFSFTKALPSKDELAAAQSYLATEVIDAVLYEGNDTYVEITARDRCGNSTTSREVLQIDVTAPRVEIVFEQNEAENNTFYRSIRTATIYVQELNFDKEGLELAITKDGEVYELPISEWESEGERHWASVTFREDGDYTMAVSCVDLADNTSEEVSAEPFTIDLTKPEIAITYDKDMANNQMYFRSERTAYITVMEHNFREEDFVLDTRQQLTLSSWSHTGDTHRAQIHFQEDDHYLFQCSYTDMAGNTADPVAEQEFFIDSIAPQIVIQGVENESANAGEVNPTVTVYDTNYSKEGVSIAVTTGTGEYIPLELAQNEVEQGYCYKLTDLSQKEDDVYYLQVTALDMAGNQNELRYRFSLNRNGSTYDLTAIAQITERVYNRSDQLMDISILEMNVDKIEEYAIYITRNGKMLTCRQTQERPKVDSDEICFDTEVSGNEEIGYSHRYVFYQENFTQEGIYRITCYSKDRAGNEMNNALDEKCAEVTFVIDNTAPKVVMDGIEEGGIYNAQSQTVHLMVQDNFCLKEACFSLVNQEGEILQSWDYMELATEVGDTVSITIPSMEGRQSLLYRVVDAAGNEITLLPEAKNAPKGFLITTNPWLRWISSPVRMAGVVLVIIVCGGVVFYFLRKALLHESACVSK